MDQRLYRCISTLCEFLFHGSVFCFCTVLVFLKEGRWIGFLLMSYTKNPLDFQTYMSWIIVIFYKDSFSIQFPKHSVACLKAESLNYGHCTFSQWDPPSKSSQFKENGRLKSITSFFTLETQTQKNLGFYKVSEDNWSRVKKLSLDLVPVCASLHGCPVSSTPIFYYSWLSFFSFLAKPKCHKLSLELRRSYR